MAERAPLPTGRNSDGPRGPRVADLAGKPYCFYTREYLCARQTVHGTRDAVDVCVAPILTPDGTTGPLEDTRIFSTVLVEQLTACVGTWVAGRIVKQTAGNGRTFWRIEGPTTEQGEHAADRAIAQLPDIPPRPEDQAAELITAAFEEEEPF